MDRQYSGTLFGHEHTLSISVSALHMTRSRTPVHNLQWRREGAACGTTGAAFGGAKIWNSEICPLLANWHLHY